MSGRINGNSVQVLMSTKLSKLLDLSSGVVD